MRQEADRLQAFYASPLGEAAAVALAERVMALWPDCSPKSLIGLGYTTPLFDRMEHGNKRRIALMPAAQGATTWAATEHGVSTALIDDTHLPIMDEAFDRAIVLHGLEEAEAPHLLLREVWRVLAPEGRVIVIAANRLGVWSSAVKTPFGHGRSWTRTQLSSLLSGASFETTAWTHGLHMPPIGWGPVLSLSDMWERAGGALVRGLGGVVMVEAVKRLYIQPGAPAKAARRTQPLRLPNVAARAPNDRAVERR